MRPLRNARRSRRHANLVRLSVRIEAVEDLVLTISRARSSRSRPRTRERRRRRRLRRDPGRLAEQVQVTGSSAASCSTDDCSPRWRIRPTTVSHRGRWPTTATRSMRSSSPTRRSPAAGSACARSACFTHVRREESPRREGALCRSATSFARVRDIDVNSEFATRSALLPALQEDLEPTKSRPRRAAQGQPLEAAAIVRGCARKEPGA